MSGGRARRTVAIIQPFVPTYRVALFDALAQQLDALDLDLEVWHDQPRGRVAARGNATTGPWSRSIKQRRISVRGHNVTFRGVLRHAREPALVIAGLASGNLETYALASDRRVNLALWGHGRNFTAANNRVDATLERWLINRSSHVFVYTQAGADHLVGSGIDADKLTVVRNSTDTTGITAARKSSDAVTARASVASWSVDGERRALFVGAFDHSKRLPLLFDAADLVHDADPEFRLWLAGDGPEAPMVREEVSKRASWVTLLPRLSPSDLGTLSHLVDIIVMPGRVGLVAADSLAMGVPIATTHHEFHAPEIEYLDDEVALWSEPRADSYAAAIGALLADRARLMAMRDAALARAGSVSAEDAARRFTFGITSALAIPSSMP